MMVLGRNYAVQARCPNGLRYVLRVFGFCHSYMLGALRGFRYCFRLH